jgi:hypothetical protein
VSGFDWQPWVGAARVQIAVGIDGLNLWQLVTLPIVGLSILVWESSRGTWRTRDFACLSGVLLGSMLAFAARDLVLLGSGAAVAFLSLLMWVRPMNDAPIASRAVAMRGMIIWGVVAGGAFLFGSALAVVSLRQVQEQKLIADPDVTSGIDDVAFQTPSIARSFGRSQLAWGQQVGGTFLAWSVAALACAGAWPLQESLVGGLRQMEIGPRLAWLCGLMPLGTYLLIRVFTPLLGEFVALGQALIIAPVVMSLFWHLGMLAHGEIPRDGPLRLALSAHLLAIVGAVTGTASGFCGAVLISLSAGWSYAAWCLLGGIDGSQPLPSSDIGILKASSRNGPQFAGQWIALSLLAGCPGSGMFAGLCLLGAGIIEGLQLRFLPGAALLALFGLMWLLLVGHAFRCVRNDGDRLDRPSFVAWKGAGGLCLLAVVIASGIASGQIVDRSRHTAGLISDRVVPAPLPEAE